MEYPHNEMSCTLSLISSDLENFETVEELYFGEREKENDQEADDSPLDESSSESEDDGETRTFIDFADTTDLSEKAKVETVNLVNVERRAALLFLWMTFMPVETTATNCP